MELSGKLERFRFNVIHLLPLLVLCLCLGFTYHLWSLAYQLAEKEQQQKFDFRANEIEILIKQHLQAYAQVLHGGRGLFIASDYVSRSEFKDYITELQIGKFFPGIQGVGFSILIPTQQKQQHLSLIRNEGYPQYTIRPAGEREFYSSIIYLEPVTKRNLLAFGYDMYSETVRRTAMDKAWRENRIAISGKVKLEQETEKNASSGFLMYLPLYRKGADISTATARWSTLRGWIYAPFRMNDFMEAVLGKKHTLKLDVDVDVYDGKQISPDTLLYNRDNDDLSYAKSLFGTVKYIEIAGHLWSLHIHSHPAFEAKIDLKRAYLTASTGFVITGLLTMVIWLLVHGRKRALTLAQQINSQLEENEALLHNIIDASHAVVQMKDLAGHYVHVNRCFKELFHLSNERVLGKTDFDIFQEDIANAFRINDLMVIGSGQAMEIEEQAPNDDGTLHTYISVKVPLRNLAGNIYATCGISTDITERKKIEIEREQFFTFFNLAPDFQCIVSMDGFFQKVNPTFMETLGFTEPELLQHSFLEFVYPEDRQSSIERFKKQWQLKEKTVLNFENRYLCKDGSLRWLSWKAVLNPDDELIYAVAHDITNRKKRDEQIRQLSDSELNKARLEAEKASRAKSEFLSRMSHELRTPMNAVLGFAQLLESDDLTEDQHDNVQEILTAGQHLLALINEVLDLSKIEAEKVEFNYSTIALNTLITRCLALLQMTAAKHKITLQNQISASNSFKVYADELRLRQVLLNLISNAIKYNRHEGVVVLSCQLAADGKLRINVKDSGAGLSAVQINKLFQPFERLDAKQSTTEGTGIGLCISKKLIEAMGGKIGVESTVGVGSCFWIEVSLA
jgi:PAS domain S-box-containing protein